ncbi:MAG TPA: helicase C-terminal domain-containing protein [Kiritimatiellia bacterium]|nr:helicase C-terminal domain-containing protein [Kiritimatiellia bacterium]HRU70778.1 helicase C-terminal domain-containing protein [Kiritimatiellia bacterium]
MLSFRTVWVTQPPGQPPVFDLFPDTGQAPDPTQETIYITQDVAAFDDLLPSGRAHGVDVLALHAFAFPDKPVENAAESLRQGGASGECLWTLWRAIEARLLTLPLWALETIELVLRELDECGLARVFGHFAECVRQAGTKCGPWLETFASEARKNERRTLPTHADCTPLDCARVAAHLLPGGTFSRLMPGYESRPGQVEMLRAVARAFNEGKHLLVEAGTGVGKSLAYLIPAAAWALLNDVPVVVSTNTRNLQTQLIEKDLPLVRAAVCADGSTLRVAVLKGRSNYVCLRRIAILLEQSQFELERPELRHFALALAWAAQTTDGDLDTFAGAGHTDAAFLAKLASTAEECPGRACRYGRRCFLQKARARAAAAHVVIANHALVFAESQAPGSALPPHAQIVFDEAHNLEEAATRHLSTELTQARLTQLLRRLSRGRGRRAGGVLEVLRTHLEKGAVTADETTAKALRQQIRQIRSALEEVQRTARFLFEALYALIQPGHAPVRFRCVSSGGEEAEKSESPGEDTLLPPGTCTREVFRDKQFSACADGWDEAEVQQRRLAVKRAIADASGLLLKLGEALRQTSEGELALYDDQAANVEGAAAALRTFASDMDFVLAATDAEHVFWAEPPSRSAGTANLYAAPLSIGEALAELLYRQKSTVVFCSATLRVGSSFGYISRRLGIDRLEPARIMTCVAESPFDYATQCAALAPVFLPAPSGPTGGAYAEQLSGLMLEVFTRTRGRAMGLFTSYEMMNQVARLLEAPLREAGVRLLVHGTNGTRDQITRIFRSGGACVLLGTHSFWEGVDVAGEALSCVVMARLPFAAVTDPIVEARCEQIERAGGSSFREFSLPQAVIRFRQGFGRLIRTRSDKGVVIVADPRVVTKTYGATFRKSLPCPMLRVESRDELLTRVEALFT